MNELLSTLTFLHVEMAKHINTYQCAIDENESEEIMKSMRAKILVIQDEIERLQQNLFELLNGEEK